MIYFFVILCLLILIQCQIIAIVNLILIVGCLVHSHPIQDETNKIEQNIEKVNANLNGELKI